MDRISSPRHEPPGLTLQQYFPRVWGKNSLLLSDVAFAAFRLCQGQPDRVSIFIEDYNSAHPPVLVADGHILPFLIYNILQRLLFILVEAQAGRREWMVDLNNQKQFLSLPLDRLSAEKENLPILS